jgi:hypothetical protein
MKKFNVEVELTNQEVELLKNVDWNDKQPKEPYGTTTEVNSLCNKGVVEYVTNDYEGDYGLFLTEVGNQIIKLIN